MKKNIIQYLLVFSLLPVLSCEELTNWDILSYETYVIADCIITNEMKYQELWLNKSINAMNEIPQGISGAFIVLGDGTNAYVFIEDLSEPGHYVSDIPFMASAGQVYRLTIVTGSYTDTAYASLTGVSPLDAMDITASDTLLQYVYHDTPGASMTEIRYDWSANPSYCAVYGGCMATEVYYTLNNIDPAKEFAPDRIKLLFPHQTQIIRRKYSLSDDHQRFIRSLLLETDWRGGFFDTEQGNIPTNFSHGIHGWFAACSVVSDTIFVE